MRSGAGQDYTRGLLCKQGANKPRCLQLLWFQHRKVLSGYPATIGFLQLATLIPNQTRTKEEARNKLRDEEEQGTLSLRQDFLDLKELWLDSVQFSKRESSFFYSSTLRRAAGEPTLS